MLFSWVLVSAALGIAGLDFTASSSSPSILLPSTPTEDVALLRLNLDDDNDDAAMTCTTTDGAAACLTSVVGSPSRSISFRVRFEPVENRSSYVVRLFSQFGTHEVSQPTYMFDGEPVFDVTVHYPARTLSACLATLPNEDAVPGSVCVEGHSM